MAKVIIMPDPDDPGFKGVLLRFFMKHLVWILLAALGLLLLLRNMYTIPADSRGIVLRFGQVAAVKTPGLHFKWPFADAVYMIAADRKRSLEFGFRIDERVRSGLQETEVPDERLMLTKDNKLIEVEWVMHYHIDVPELYLFNLPQGAQEKEKILRDLCMATMRRIFAGVMFDEGLTTGKQGIQDRARLVLQETFNSLKIGIRIDEVLLQETNVSDSIREEYNSVTSAEEQVKNMIYQAEAHANKVIPEAEGRAAVLLNEGEAYKFKRISEAEGEAARLNLLQEAYALNPELTRLNMWAEGMAEVWSRLKVVFVDGLGAESGTVKLLPLPMKSWEMMKDPSETGLKNEEKRGDER
ncbi:MAG: FtsH protease activity modulator HflK [Fretibacterium sp.]|nr:FtsH protease activity modulator HflK [Fretibacterium sp.]